MRPRRSLPLLLIVAAVVLVADVVSKQLVVAHLSNRAPVNVIPSVLDLELTRTEAICRALDFSALARGLGATPSDLDCPEKLGQLNFVKEVLVSSQTSIAVLSGVPNGV